MSSAMHDQMESALADLRAQQKRIREFRASMAARTTVITSKDKMIAATVNSNGRLVELSFKGNRYRNLAPAELSALIVDTVGRAQETASRQALQTAAELIPGGFAFAAPGGEPDLDEMFEAAVRLAEQPLFTDEVVLGEARKEAGGV